MKIEKSLRNGLPQPYIQCPFLHNSRALIRLVPIWISFGLFVNEDVFGGFYLFNSVNSAHSTNVNSAQPDVLILYFSLELIFNQKRRDQGV